MSRVVSADRPRQSASRGVLFFVGAGEVVARDPRGVKMVTPYAISLSSGSCSRRARTADNLF